MVPDYCVLFGRRTRLAAPSIWGRPPSQGTTLGRLVEKTLEKHPVRRVEDAVGGTAQVCEDFSMGASSHQARGATL
jgi:hypothetical protein